MPDGCSGWGDSDVQHNHAWYIIPLSLTLQFRLSCHSKCLPDWQPSVCLFPYHCAVRHPLTILYYTIAGPQWEATHGAREALPRSAGSGRRAGLVVCSATIQMTQSAAACIKHNLVHPRSAPLPPFMDWFKPGPASFPSYSADLGGWGCRGPPAGPGAL